MSPEDRAFAELFLDLKGHQRKRLDWIAIAQRCKFLADRYRTKAELAGKLGVSPHLVRSIIKLLDLPDEVQSILERRELDYDAAYRLNTLKDARLQIAVAKAMVGLTSHRQREMIQYARKFPKRSLKAFRRRLERARKSPRRLDAVLVTFDGETFGLLRQHAQRAGLSIQETIRVATKTFIGASDSK